MIIQLSVLSLIRLYTVGWWINTRVWMWPNGPGTNIERQKWWYRAQHPRHGSPAMLGQPLPVSMIVAELRHARAALAKVAAARRAALADLEIAHRQVQWIGVT